MRINAHFENGKLKGAVKITHPEGSFMNVHFVNNVMEGKGKMRFGSRARLIGVFSQNVLHGWQTFISPIGDRFEGEWVEGELSGPLTLTRRSGERVSIEPDDEAAMEEFWALVPEEQIGY